MHKVNISIVGCGYIGKKVASKLLSLGASVECYVHSAGSKEACEALDLRANLLELDNSDFSNEWHVQDKNIIAYFAPPPRHGISDTRMTHFISTLENLKSTPNKIVLISTTGIYGDCQGEWIDESRAVNPQADRAHRRLSAENQLQQYCQSKNIECIIFRVPGIYAIDKLPEKRITSGEPIVSAVDSGYTNRIHAEDLSEFCVEALTQKIKPGVYNCCDGNPSTMNDYFVRVADFLGIDRPKEISLQQAKKELSAGMLSYLAESKRISNKKLLDNFSTKFKYPDLQSTLQK